MNFFGPYLPHNEISNRRQHSLIQSLVLGGWGWDKGIFVVVVVVFIFWASKLCIDYKILLRFVALSKIFCLPQKFCRIFMAMPEPLPHQKIKWCFP